MMGYRYGYNMMGGWFGVMIIPIILIGVVIFLFFRKGQNNTTNDMVGRDNSLDILNERFARGEINEDEYNQRKNVLSKHKSL